MVKKNKKSQSLSKRTAKTPARQPAARRPGEYLLNAKSMSSLLDRIGAPFTPDGQVSTRWDAALGCQTSEVALSLLAQVVSLQHLPPDAPDDKVDGALSTATAKLAELKPRNALEAMLAAHLVGTQQLAMTYATRATWPQQTREGEELNANRHARISRIFLEQVEMFARLQGLVTQQRVVVERVDVQAGGQALVGAVATPHALPPASIVAPAPIHAVGVGGRRKGTPR